MSMILLQVWFTKFVSLMTDGSTYTSSEDRMTESESNDFLYSTVTDDKSWVHRYNPEMKSQSLELSSSHFSKKEKIQDSTFCWKIHVHHFLELQRHHLPRVRGRKYKNQPKTQMNTLQMSKQWISHVGWGKCWCWNMIMSHPTLVLPHQWRQYSFWSCPTPSLQPVSGIVEFWIFATLKKHFKGIHFACDEEVQADMGKWYWEQPEEFYGKRFEKLVQHWWHCVEREGECVEKLGT